LIRPIGPARVLSSSERRHCRIGKKGAIALEQCPLRRRRDGATVKARTKEPSSVRVRVLSRKKASRSFQRRQPSRDGAREGPWPKRNMMWPSRPRHVSNRRPGCPGRDEKGTREIVQRARVLPFSSGPDSQSAFPRKWISTRASRRHQTATHRLSMRQRITEPTQPASVGAGVQRSESSTRV